jgi:hypothetical protein
MAMQTGDAFSNSRDYPLLREFLTELMRSDPFSRYAAHGVGVGRKVVAGKPTDRLALRFHVPYKIPSSRVLPEQLIPETFHYFSREQNRALDLLTDVIESSPGRPHVDPESVVRPIPGGVSCSGHADAWPGSGTIGGWVWDNTDDTIVMLSNQHVFGNTGGTPILQPGSADGGVFPQDRVGAVKRSIPLVTAPQPLSQAVYPDDCNFVDAAIASVDDSENFDLTVLEIGPAVYEIADPVVDMDVEKFGQTTGHTVGRVTDVPYNTVFPYPVEGDVIMCDCFRYETSDPDHLPISDHGDSGSLVFRQGGTSVIKPVVGLLFGGGTAANNNWSVACTIREVFQALDLGPLCIAGCAAFVDALYADEAEDDSDIAGINPVYTAPERRRHRTGRLHTGLTLDLQKRFLISLRGRAFIRLINRHQSELLTLVVTKGDFRRALLTALRPILRGAVTTTDVLERRLDKQDLDRLNRALDVVDTQGSPEFRKSLRFVRALLLEAEGRSLSEIFRIRVR